MDELLAAIRKQRWYFFENNEYIVFDRDTALLWANLDKFPYEKDNHSSYSENNGCLEVKNMIFDRNAESWGGYRDWKIPTPTEMWKMIEDRTFPYQSGDNWRIKTAPFWCVDNNGFASKNLDARVAGPLLGFGVSHGVYVIPCSHALVPENYSATPEEVLAIFIANELVPKFSSARIDNLFAQYKPNPSSLDYNDLLKDYNLDAIAESPIQYYAAAQKVAGEVLTILQDYESEHEVQLDDARVQVRAIQMEAAEFSSRLQKANRGQSIFSGLAELENEPRPSFKFLVENIAKIVIDAQRAVESE